MPDDLSCQREKIQQVERRVGALETGQTDLTTSVSKLSARFDVFATKIETSVKVTSYIIGAVAILIGVLYTIQWLRVPHI